jgi:DNA-binding transcriptional ArsR family regulator
MKTADLLLHPIRLRVAQALLGDRELTTRQLQDELPDVPPATLYRQVAALARAEVLEVTEQRRVRGAVEKVYRLRTDRANVSAEDASGMSAEAHRHAFMTFVAGLLADFDRYLDSDFNMARDGVGYRQVALNLSDTELAELAQDLSEVFVARLSNSPGQGRVRRLLTTILMPTR